MGPRMRQDSVKVLYAEKQEFPLLSIAELCCICLFGNVPTCTLQDCETFTGMKVKNDVEASRAMFCS